jgi:hypothetical protein
MSASRRFFGTARGSDKSSIWYGPHALPLFGIPLRWAVFRFDCIAIQGFPPVATGLNNRTSCDEYAYGEVAALLSRCHDPWRVFYLYPASLRITAASAPGECLPAAYPIQESFHV